MEIKDIGLFLKEKREEKSISLEEIEEILKIRKKYLTAIEEGNFSILPGETYVLGYLRNYCKYLNISDEEIDGIIKSYKGLEKQQEKIDAKKEEVLSLRKKRTINFERKSNLVNFRYVYLAGFVIFLFVGVLFFNNYLRNAKNYPLPSPEVNTIIDVVTETPENSTIEVSEDIIITEEIVVSKIPVLKVFAKDNTWFKVLFDDTLIFEGILLKSEKMSFKTRNNLKLLTMFPNNLVAFIDDEETDLNYSTKDNQMFEYQFNKISENS
ncbi:MAG: helix-turn-helix domain-containing protein [Candidatus Caldatribacteriota bacterium]|nr:helix-turn-helix domain-containing protein [Candidatus Caldatribacteriota bacterium]